MERDTLSMERLVGTVQELSLVRDLPSVMKVIRKAARELTNADGASFILREKDLCFYADEDTISPLWKGNRFPMTVCISGWSMIHREAVVIEDIYADPRVPHDVYRPTFVKSLAMVPIRRLDPIGAIGTYWADNHKTTASELAILQSLADITAVSMENVSVYSELESRVLQRTAELENANKSLEAFSHSVSHDLRAPIRAIRTYAQILAESVGEAATERQQNASQRIVFNVDRMEKLIEGLLSFSMAGWQDIRRQPVDMTPIVRELCDGFKESERAVKFLIGPLPQMSVDPVLIRQVWVNLLSNAVKYSSKCVSPVVEVGCVDDKDNVVFFVKDNGVGFDMAYSNKLFRVFERLHSPKDFDGVGVGLSIAERIVARHDGKMWAESRPGEGATFFFSLPT